MGSGLSPQPPAVLASVVSVKRKTPGETRCCVKWTSLVQVITRTRNDVETYYKLISNKPNKHVA
jgi:hypothetical protein